MVVADYFYGYLKATSYYRVLPSNFNTH